MFAFEKEYKTWTLPRIARHLVYWGFWLLFYGFLNASYQGFGYLNWLLHELLFMTVKLPYTYFVAYYLFPRFLPQKKYVHLVLWMLLVSFVGVAIMVWLIDWFPEIAYDQPSEFWSVKTLYRAVDLIYVASLVVIIKMIQHYVRQERTTNRLKEEKMNSELQILKNQLQPHFLFNTLNNIYGMVLEGDKQAATMILKLSDLISYMLYECNADRVPLTKEIDLIKNYVDLEQIRYGARLDIKMDFSGDFASGEIAPLLLIPFVENAFKHGVSQSSRTSRLKITLHLDGNRLLLGVENSIHQDGSSPSLLKSGIGLENVRRRLNLIYADRHQLSIKTTDVYAVYLNIEL